jgi:adenosine deaminase
MQITRDLLFALPKTDLHVHLDGSLRVKTAIELAKASNIALPSYKEDEVRDFLSVKGQVESLKTYLEKFDFTLQLMQDDDSIRRIAYELAETLRGRISRTWKCATRRFCTSGKA